MKKFWIIVNLIMVLSSLLIPTVNAEDEVLSKYNFIPGEKLIGFEDLSGVAIGEIPVGTIKVNGEAETVMVGGQKYLKMGAGAEIIVDLPQTKDLSLEFYLKEKGTDGSSFRMFIENPDKDYDSIIDAGTEELHWEGVYKGKDLPSGSSSKKFYQENQLVQYALTLQPERTKLYINKILAVNSAGFSPVMPSQIRISFNDAELFLVKDITVATVIPNIADEILKKGKYTSHGIQFDTGSAQVREESYSVLKQVADVVKNNPGLKLMIIGHTDNTGSKEGNQKLSNERAESIRQYLVGRFGINNAVLQTKGVGDTQPVADNKTVEGRAINRRVEFLKTTK